MKGDKLVIQQGHVKAARQLMKWLLPQIARTPTKFVVAIAAESGGGKSEIATALSEALSAEGIRSTIICQDDYFVYPPKTNAAMRKTDIGHVGLSEVHLALLDQNLKEILDGRPEIEKPLVDFDADLITQETLSLEGVKVVIVDGTYTSLLQNVHQRVFIDRTYVDTRETRKRRAREEQDEFLEQILEIEHKLISPQKQHADLIVTKEYEVTTPDRTRG